MNLFGCDPKEPCKGIGQEERKFALSSQFSLWAAGTRFPGNLWDPGKTLALKLAHLRARDIPALISLCLRVEEGAQSLPLLGCPIGYRVGCGCKRKLNAKKHRRSQLEVTEAVRTRR